MNANDVVSVITASGEYVGKLVSQNDNGTLTIEDPRLLVSNKDGGVGFAKGVCMTGKLNTSEVTFKDYIYCTPTDENFEKSYRQAVSGILM